MRDDRRGHGLRHRQSFVLACAVVAMLMDADTGIVSKTARTTGATSGMGEDASGISKRPQAHMMACLRNHTLGLFEGQQDRNKDSFPSWRRKMTPS